jgi:class 3 adenylate cyclase
MNGGLAGASAALVFVFLGPSNRNDAREGLGHVAGGVFVSGTTRELVIGAGIEFVDRGVRELKGISGERPIYEARLQA